MSAQSAPGAFQASFTYTDAVLKDFEAMYLQKKETPLAMRLVLGILGALGAGYFGWMLYRDGVQLTRIGYLLICSVMLVIAFSRGKARPDDSLAKYRKYYLDHRADFKIDAEGVEFQLEGQQHPARSKFKEIYSLCDTDRCLYFVIKGRAFYILPRDSVTGGSAEDLMKYMQKQCGKSFVHYDLSKS